MKNIILTGSTRGLGLAIAVKLLEEGYRVLATGRNISNKLLVLKDKFDCLELGKLIFYPLDLNVIGDIRRFVKEATNKFGRPYGLINNAGIGYESVLATMHESQIEELLTVNLRAPIVMTKYISRLMLLEGEGRVINISSIIANTGYNGLSVYAASKSGLNGLTKSLARELGKGGITVNTISPGFMETDMTLNLQGEQLEKIIRRSPMKKLVSVNDVANAVSYFLSDDASLITGANLVIDAGNTA